MKLKLKFVYLPKYPALDVASGKEEEVYFDGMYGFATTGNRLYSNVVPLESKSIRFLKIRTKKLKAIYNPFVLFSILLLKLGHIVQFFLYILFFPLIILYKDIKKQYGRHH